MSGILKYLPVKAVTINMSHNTKELRLSKGLKMLKASVKNPLEMYVLSIEKERVSTVVTPKVKIDCIAWKRTKWFFLFRSKMIIPVIQPNK